MDMFQQYVDWVKQIRFEVERWGFKRVEGSYKSIIIAGMGGSGIVGDYVARLSEYYGGLPVLVYKSHTPPRFTSSSDLVIVVSYSGNTLETIRFLEGVLGRSDIVVVSSGGVLRDISLRHNLVYVDIPHGYAPRVALPSMLFSILGLLDASGYTIVSRDMVLKLISFLESEMSEIIGLAREIAGFIHSNNGLPIIATHYPFDALAIRAKNEFNENSKIPVKVEVAPEWMHNDIVGWENPPGGLLFNAIAFYDPVDATGVKLVEYMINVYRERGIPVYSFALKGSGLLERLMYGSLLFGLSSVILAGFRGLDPLETRSIQRYKMVVKDIF